ncbi:hypothetical protein [Mycobacterium intracellulare]|uniref:Uncharacterized protein n=1 Tax=Mycobacterium intracellulare TaxID=1767 RepID=A0AAE4UAT8_MYCIT|nr:hypothetical protein [Mycobacterium intracellulare]MDV6979676.1 hypothetical protein [Mycobacterium intracellulare]MDV6985179.1 hypothetical protein [Mycobacterium intracellulare]MDV7014201.1 hypothetical protein [Mycobacterium intracellulare]MDV7030170.1 hypothetical protein [Mycobacterium intracellulare]
MSEALTVALIAGGFTALAPICTLIGIRLERRVKHKNADAALQTSDAALQQAEAAKEEAEAAKDEAEAAKRQADAALVAAVAEMRRAVTAEREQANADWARFCDAKDREIASLRDRVERNDERLGQAEMRALADRERADRSDRLYWKAVVYLRIVIRWINDEHPGEEFPAPPTELIADL